MRLAAALASAFLLVSGCATAVYDSLERRGVDSAEILTARMDEAAADARIAKSSLAGAANALRAIDNLDGDALARQIDKAYAASADVGVRAQDLRASTASMRSAGARHFADRTADLQFIEDAAERSAENEKLKSDRDAYGRVSDAFNGANLRLSASVTALNAETSFLRRNISKVAVASRAAERAAAISGFDDAISALDAAIDAAENY